MFDISQHLAKAKHLPHLLPEVAYHLQPSLSYASARKARPNDLRDQAVPLYNPPFTSRGRILSADAAGHEKELLRYYAAVLQAGQQHRKDPNALRHYFWLRPVLLNEGKAVVSFPWYDTYPEAASLLLALQEPDKQGLLFDDMDQGWQVEIYATNDKIYLAEGSGEDDDVPTVYVTSRPRLAKLAAEALVRLRHQLAFLVQQTGQNPWRYQA